MMLSNFGITGMCHNVLTDVSVNTSAIRRSAEWTTYINHTDQSISVLRDIDDFYKACRILNIPMWKVGTYVHDMRLEGLTVSRTNKFLMDKVDIRHFADPNLHADKELDRMAREAIKNARLENRLLKAGTDLKKFVESHDRTSVWICTSDGASKFNRYKIGSRPKVPVPYDIIVARRKIRTKNFRMLPRPFWCLMRSGTHSDVYVRSTFYLGEVEKEIETIGVTLVVVCPLSGYEDVLTDLFSLRRRTEENISPD